MTDTHTPSGVVSGLGRRRFIGYVIAAPTLMTGAKLLTGGERAGAQTGPLAVPSTGQLAEYYDLIDFLRDSQLPTSNLITIEVNEDGTVGFELHRTEVGQGLTTSLGMVIADEMGVPLDAVRMTQADARPELLFNQITGGSHSTYSLYNPLRIAAALARERILSAGALLLGFEANRLELVDGIVRAPDGTNLGIGELAAEAASELTEAVEVAEGALRSEQTLVGTPRNRVDSRSMVTGERKYTLDLDLPDALPTMLCRPPTINGTVISVNNRAAVEAMPGVTHVTVVSTATTDAPGAPIGAQVGGPPLGAGSPQAVAVRARTFGQCIDAVRALDVTWGAGSADAESDQTVRDELHAGELPVLSLDADALVDRLEASLPDSVDLSVLDGITGLLGDLGQASPVKSMQRSYTFAFQSNTPLEPNSAVVDPNGVDGKIEIWAPLKNPLVAEQRLNEEFGGGPAGTELGGSTRVKVHVVQAGGSFGRELFWDAAAEAARVAVAIGEPVRLMWHRTDEFRQGRTHPACRSTIGAIFTDETGILTYNQSHTSVMTDFGHGLGDALSADLATVPPEVSDLIGQQQFVPDIPGAGDIGYSQTVWHLTQFVPYNVGLPVQVLNEVNNNHRTSSMRNIYSPNSVTARELFLDEICEILGRDPFEFRMSTLKDERSKAVMAKVGEVGNWGRTMAPGTAQGLGFHAEYKGRIACLMEIDATAATVDRNLPVGFGGPRITKAVVAIDVGKPINPRGIEAQVMGGMMDGIANALTYSLHLANGNFLEGTWDQAHYTRQWNVPFDLEIIVMPPTSATPGGMGEFGVAASMAAAATSYARATGTKPTSFPINHDRADLGFEPIPPDAPIPASPTDGLSR